MATTHRSVELVIAVVALIPGLGITFIPDHTAATGLLIFGVWALVAGVATFWMLGRLPAEQRSQGRQLAWGITALFGLVALVTLGLGQTGAMHLLIGAWGAVFGAVGLLAWRVARTGQQHTEAPFVSLLTLVFGVAQLLMPPNSVVNVGLFGAYLAILGVWTGIGALSPQPNSSVGGPTTPGGQP